MAVPLGRYLALSSPHWNYCNIARGDKGFSLSIDYWCPIIRFTSRRMHEIGVKFSNGKTMRISSGKYARFANSCANADLGDTSVMAVVVSKEKSILNSFLPLTVDYRQKAAALGRIPTNFLRRELGPTDLEILTCRVIDRSLRPLFAEGYNHDTQLTCSPISVDGINHPDVLAINAASAALALSDIPWNGPVGAVRVGLVEKTFLVNPTKKELSKSSLNLIVTGTENNAIVMLEGYANNILESDFMDAISFGVKECGKIAASIKELQEKFGKVKQEVQKSEISCEVEEGIRILSEIRLKEIFTNFNHDKVSRDEAVSKVKTDVAEKMRSCFPDLDLAVVYEAFNKLVKEVFRTLILSSNLRCDGRRPNDLRNISCSVGLYKPLHGSALFQRGQTQVLCTVTLDSPNSALKLDPISILTSGLKEKNFFLHYEFPPFATNEIGRTGPAGRREIGHGALAEKGLKPILPSNFPFTVRLTSEVLESNGSSSMASICGGSLALMDAGVPVSSAAAGVAVGLITKPEFDVNQDSSYALLMDILGIEDYIGDMDFKLAGTKTGITALQADIKISGVPLKVITKAVEMGSRGISQIIDIMDKSISVPRHDGKENWPVIEKIEIPVHKRPLFIGTGGINVKRLEMETGVQVTEEADGKFALYAVDQMSMNEAKEMIEAVLVDSQEMKLEFGGIYTAKIVEVRDMGCMVTLYANMKPVLVHNSQLDHRKIWHPSALGLEVGQELTLKYFGRDPVSGSMRLSRKVLQSVASSARQDLVNKQS